MCEPAVYFVFSFYYFKVQLIHFHFGDHIHILQLSILPTTNELRSVFPFQFGKGILESQLGIGWYIQNDQSDTSHLLQDSPRKKISYFSLWLIELHF